MTSATQAADRSAASEWEQFADVLHERETVSLGMWLFLGTEILVFGALLAAYVLYRLAYPAAFLAGSNRLNAGIAGMNTVVLLTSSLTMVLAVRAAERQKRNGTVLFLGVTAVLGIAFLGLKAVEYRLDYLEGLVP